MTIQEKSYQFAIRCIEIYKYLVSEQREFVLSKQFLRSGTAIGAMVREAKYAESKLDFIHKLSISLKEANETAYWLDLLNASKYLNDHIFSELSARNNEMIRILISIVKTSKENLQIKKKP